MWQGSAERSEAGVEAELPPERDSPAAQAGSEPQVSHEIDATIHSHPGGPPALLVGEEMATPLRGGTTSSNLAPPGSPSDWPGPSGPRPRLHRAPAALRPDASEPPGYSRPRL